MQTDIWEFDEKKAIEAINKYEAKRVLLQFPDGIKPHAANIRRQLLDQTQAAEIFVWAGSNFGACDLPIEARSVGVDLIIHFGHAPWNYKREVIS